MRDLLHQSETAALVRQSYRSIASGRAAGSVLYERAQLDLVPTGAVDWSLGVGNPLAWVQLRPGEVVLDLGSGGGIDTILAARHVAPAGRAIGLDVLPEMLERARAHAAEAGVDNVEFVEGQMEDIPLPDDSVDVIVSNGVINLSARKMRVLLECARVLRPDGRFCVADLTIDEEALPAEVLTHPSAWAG